MKKTSLIILLFSISIVSFAKPHKLAKGIAFEGEVINKEPSGFGTLTIMQQDFITIRGTFNGEKVSQATLQYGDGNSRKWDEDRYLYNILEGNFTISHDKKWEQIAIGAPSVKIEGDENLNLGTINIKNDEGRFKIIDASKTVFYSSIPEIKNPHAISLLGYTVKDCLTECEFTFGRGNSGAHIVMVSSLGRIKFSDGATLKRNEYNSPSGDFLEAEDLDRSDRTAFLLAFRLHDKEDNVYRLDIGDWCFHYKQPKLTIYYSDGSKYVGSVLLDSCLKRSNCDNFGMDYYKKIKSYTKNSLPYYSGIYTDSSGNKTEYIKGLTRAQVEAEEKKEELARQKEETQLKIEAAKKYNNLVKKYGEKYAKAIKNRKILVGMTMEMMKETRLYWKIQYEDRYSTVYKGYFYYGSKPYVYVTLRNGKVTEVLYE